MTKEIEIVFADSDDNVTDDPNNACTIYAVINGDNAVSAHKSVLWNIRVYDHVFFMSHENALLLAKAINKVVGIADDLKKREPTQLVFL